MKYGRPLKSHQSYGLIPKPHFSGKVVWAWDSALKALRLPQFRFCIDHHPISNQKLDSGKHLQKVGIFQACRAPYIHSSRKCITCYEKNWQRASTHTNKYNLNYCTSLARSSYRGELVPDLAKTIQHRLQSLFWELNIQTSDTGQLIGALWCVSNLGTLSQRNERGSWHVINILNCLVL